MNEIAPHLHRVCTSSQLYLRVPFLDRKAWLAFERRYRQEKYLRWPYLETLDRLSLSLRCRLRGDSQAFSAEVCAPPPIIHYCPVDSAAHGNHLWRLGYRDDLCGV